MDSKFLKEALFSGMTSNAFKLGTVLALGWFWMRTAGCHTIYRGQDGVFDYDNIQAVMSIADPQVTIPGQGLPANTIWHYIRRQVSHCGLEGDDSSPCIVIIDSAGDMIGNTPNPPVNLEIEQLADGKLKLRWRYTRVSEEIAPTGFKIYMDSGEGFNFGLPEDIVVYRHTPEYSWTSDELVDDQLYKFCVRSYRTAAGESQNTNYVSARADSQGPDAITGLAIDWEEIV
jgi:hypothetical protein